jgi:hypothetical protein
MWTPDVRAQEPAPPPPEPSAESPTPAPEVDAATERARVAFTRGVAYARLEKWHEALASFEIAAKNHDLPLVQFNIALGQRALGRYVAARETTARVLAGSREGLAEADITDLSALSEEFEKILVEAEVTLDPPTAALSIDGRALTRSSPSQPWLAGIAPPGSRPVSEKHFTVVLDPGVHVIRATRKGHQDVVVKKSFRAGERTKLDLRLDELPATIHIKSVPDGAIVRVGEREVGLAPIQFERKAGNYQLEVVQDGYEPYTAKLDLSAGERVDLTAEMVVHDPSILTRWWFWGAAGVVIAGGAVLTWALTRPDPEPPPYEGGTTNWVAQPAMFRF